jgi:hypothetical protein
MEINVQNDINLSSLENTNQNDDLLDLTDDKKTKKPAKSTAKTTAKTTEGEQNPDTLDEDDNVYKIDTYKSSRLSKYLTAITTTGPENKSIEEFEALLTRIKDALDSRRTNGFMNMATAALPFGIEDIGCKAGLELQGYGIAVNMNEEYHEACEEMLIEYNITDKLKADPLTRLGMILSLSAYQIHNRNLEIKQKLDSKVDHLKYQGL